MGKQTIWLLSSSVGILLAVAMCGTAQAQDIGQTTPAAAAAVYTGKPGELVKTRTARVVVTGVNLADRSIDVAAQKSGSGPRAYVLGIEKKKWKSFNEANLRFSQPAGFEKIELSKKAARESKHHAVTLENLTVGSVLKVDHYRVYRADEPNNLMIVLAVVENYQAPLAK